MKLQVKFSDISEDIKVGFQDNTQDIPVKFENLQRVTEYIGGDVYWDDVLDKPFETLEEVKEAVLADLPEGGGGGVTSWNDLEDKPVFAEIATSGSWNDLTDKPFEEVPPLFDIQWDGNMDGHDTVEDGGGNYLVKVSDDVYTAEQVLGAIVYYSDNYNEVISEDDIHTDIPGTLDLWTEVFLIYSADELIAAMGLPEGSVSNGVWFANFVSEGYYVNRFVASHGIQTIDEKYIPNTIARTSDIPEVPTKLSELENDTKFITADEVPESGVTSWNDLEDKPFGETDIVGWKEVAVGSSSATGQVTSLTITNMPSDFMPVIGKKYKVVANVFMSPSGTIENIGVATKRDLVTFAIYDIGSDEDAVRISMRTLSGNTKVIDWNVFFAEPINSLMGVRVGIYEAEPGIIPLDEKYIPDTIARVADIPEMPEVDVPTKLSEFENDAGFITANDIPSVPSIEEIIASLPIYNGEVEEV